MLKFKTLLKSKININPQQELFKWGGIDFRIFYGSVFIETILAEAAQNLPWSWPPTLCIVVNGEITWVNEYLALQKVGLRYFRKYFLDFKEYEKLWKQWEIWVKDYQIISRQLENVKWSDLSSKELLKLVKGFHKLNVRFWLIVHIPEVANWGGEHLLKKKIESIDPENVNKNL